MSETIYELAGSERGVLVYYLNRMRDAVVRTSEGLTDDQQRTPGVPSGTNLLGLIRHLTWVEEHWFQRVFLGEEIDSDEVDGRARRRDPRGRRRRLPEGMRPE